MRTPKKRISSEVNILTKANRFYLEILTLPRYLITQVTYLKQVSGTR